MIIYRGLLKRFDNVLDWDQVQKSGLVLSILVAVMLYYLVFQVYQSYFPSRYINYELLIQMKWGIPLLIVSTIGLMQFGKYGNQYAWINKIFPYLATIHYAVALIISGYMIGLGNMTTGLVMAGAPLFGFVLFKRHIIYTAFIISTALIIFISFLSSYSFIPYGPLFKPEFFYKPEARPFYLICMIYFSIPHFVCIFGFCDLFFVQWRKRERKIQKLSVTDGLTNLYNRRAITKLLEKQLLDSSTSAQPVSVILLDVDLFKRINDVYGHIVGDKALIAVASTLQNTLRKVDLLGRYGGEEFLVVLSHTDLHQAMFIAERCRQAICDTVICNDDNEALQISASFGVASSTQCGYQAEKIVRQADKYLYQAKGQGRNQVVSILNTVTV